MSDFLKAMGFTPQPIAGPLKVFQRDQYVGTVPAFPVVSTSFIFDVRADDFKPEERDGETVLIASPMIGPGDFECIAGFRHPNGGEARKGDMATMFDVMVAAAKASKQ